MPELKIRKKVLIVGHENNLRSLIKRLDSISNEDILHIELPRAIPLVYRIDLQTMKPIPSPNAAPGLKGKYLGDQQKLKKIAERDYRQVYDLSRKDSLEVPSW